MEVRDPEGKAVKCYAFTIAACRTEEVAKPRNPPSFVAQTPDKSPGVRSEVEAAIQQWAEDAG